MIIGHVDRDLGLLAIASAGVGGLIINELLYGGPVVVALLSAVLGGVVAVIFADIFWDGWLDEKGEST